MKYAGSTHYYKEPDIWLLDVNDVMCQAVFKSQKSAATVDHVQCALMYIVNKH